MSSERIKLVIVEDEFEIAEDIKARLEQAGYGVLAIFARGEDALPFILSHEPDILLVDIRLQGSMDGIGLVTELQKRIDVPVVYITANSEPATYTRARLTHPHAFLVKPFTAINLLSAVDLALYHFSEGKTPALIGTPQVEKYDDASFVIHQDLFIRTNSKYKKISIEDLLFAEAAGSYVHVQTVAERYTLSHNLAQFQKKTPLAALVRIHRSYVINISHVDQFDDSFVFLKNHKLPIGDAYKNDFLSRVHML